MSGYLRRLVTRSLRSTPAVHSALSLPFATLPSFNDTHDAPIARYSEGVFAPQHNTSRSHSSVPDHFSTLQEDKSEAIDAIDSDVLHRKPIISGYKASSVSDAISEKSSGHETNGQSSFDNVQSNFDIFQEQSPHLTNRKAELKESIQSRTLPNNSAEKKPTAVDTSMNQETNNSAVTSLVEDTFPFFEDTPWQRQASQAKAERSEYQEPPPRLVEGSRAKTQNPRQQQSSISGHDKRKLGNNISLKQIHAEPTEVHVTIGRIEVTAVHAPPAAKRQSEPVNKLMSLDEYLASRQKGRI